MDLEKLKMFYRRVLIQFSLYPFVLESTKEHYILLYNFAYFELGRSLRRWSHNKHEMVGKRSKDGIMVAIPYVEQHIQ